MTPADVHARTVPVATDTGPTEEDAAAASLAPGDSVGQDYTIIELIEIGGTGEVYRARHEAMGRDVAIKVIRPSLRSKDDLVKRQQREARALATVDDHGVVKVFHAGTDDRVGFYIVMELLDGKPLRQIMHWMPKMPPRDALSILVEAAETTTILHGRGIYHRDLKPENLFVAKVRDENRQARIRIKILDLGAAKNINPKPTRRGQQKPSTLVKIVTPRYMSPEQSNNLPASPASDQYSMAVVGYEMLAGVHPYGQSHEGEATYMMWAMWHLSALRPPLHKVNPELADYLWPVFERALSPNPEDRFPTMLEFAHALRGLLARCLEDETQQGMNTELGGWMTTALESKDSGVRASRTEVMTYPQRSRARFSAPVKDVAPQPTVPSPSPGQPSVLSVAASPPSERVSVPIEPRLVETDLAEAADAREVPVLVTDPTLPWDSAGPTFPRAFNDEEIARKTPAAATRRGLVTVVVVATLAALAFAGLMSLRHEAHDEGPITSGADLAPPRPLAPPASDVEVDSEDPVAPSGQPLEAPSAAQIESAAPSVHSPPKPRAPLPSTRSTPVSSPQRRPAPPTRPPIPDDLPPFPVIPYQ